VVYFILFCRYAYSITNRHSDARSSSAVKAAAPSIDPPGTGGGPPNQEPGEAVVAWMPPTRAMTHANSLEQNSSNPPLMPETAAVEAAAPSRDLPAMSDPPD
jgi:hypothetical protein